MAAEVRCETTLGALACEPETSADAFLFTVVVDFAEPVPHKLGYIVKLKVVDPSFNFTVLDHPPNLRFVRFCHVFVQSASWDAAPKVRWVGDILRLRRFKFEIGDKGELVAFERTLSSNWLLFSPFEGCDRHTSAKSSFTKNADRTLNEFESRRLHDLRVWTRQFFAHYSLTSIIWWNALTAARMGGVDLLLRVTRVDGEKGLLQFADRCGRRFSLQIRAPAALSAGDAIKLRCVDVRHTVNSRNYEIELTSRSSCMLLPDFFADASRIAPLPPFETPRSGFVTKVLGSKANLVPVSFRRLQLIIARKAISHLNDTFLVEAQLKDVLASAKEGVFHPIVSLGRSTATGLCTHLVLRLQQSSDFLDVHVAELLDSRMFSSLLNRRPFGCQETSTDQLLAYLQRLAARRRPVRLLLQLMITHSRLPFYRVVDTAFTVATLAPLA